MTAEILSTAEIPLPTRLRLLADTFRNVLGESDYCQIMRQSADELESAQRDTKRLNWLDGEKKYAFTWEVVAYEINQTDIRSAIDAHIAHIPKLSAPSNHPASGLKTSYPEPQEKERENL